MEKKEKDEELGCVWHIEHVYRQKRFMTGGKAAFWNATALMKNILLRGSLHDPHLRPE